VLRDVGLKPALGLMHRSDRGVQFISLYFSKSLEDDLLPSMRRIGLELRPIGGSAECKAALMLDHAGSS
jgi:hypothetical protein